MLLLVFGPSTPLALAGVLLWGVEASIGYCAFLGGPPLIGYLGPNSPFGKPLSRLLSQSGWQLWSPDPCGPVLTKSGETRE